MTLMLTGSQTSVVVVVVVCARTHALTQTKFMTLNVLRSTDKKRKKALGIGLISGCLVKERTKRGREGRRGWVEAEGERRVSFLSFPWGGDRAARAHAPTAAIEQLLVCRFENL